MCDSLDGSNFISYFESLVRKREAASWIKVTLAGLGPGPHEPESLRVGRYNRLNESASNVYFY